MSDSIFVYGTLRKDVLSHIHARYLGDRAEYIGPATAAGDLWRVTWYPALTRGSGRVRGEVYRLLDPAAWTGLDEFEACDLANPESSEYTREIVPVRLDDGREIPAWCYFYLGETASLTRIDSGDFADCVCRNEHE